MPATEAAVRLRVLFAGRVQGVGFRYTAAQVASHHLVTGYVRNLPDGRVEMVVEGRPAELQHFVSAVQSQMDGCIRDTQITQEPATGEFASFQIRH